MSVRKIVGFVWVIVSVIYSEFCFLCSRGQPFFASSEPWKKKIKFNSKVLNQGCIHVVLR